MTTIAELVREMTIQPQTIAEPPTVFADLWGDEQQPSRLVEKKVVAKKQASGFITRKALIEKLQAMNPDEVLFPWYQRFQNGNKAGYMGLAAERALSLFMPSVVFGQATYCTPKGAQKETPRWFRQVYTEITFSDDDVTPRSILETLCA